eukprot:11673226-Heterocapsa_arctica.AAC.1
MDTYDINVVTAVETVQGGAARSKLEEVYDTEEEQFRHVTSAHSTDDVYDFRRSELESLPRPRRRDDRRHESNVTVMKFEG